MSPALIDLQGKIGQTFDVSGALPPRSIAAHIRFLTFRNYPLVCSVNIFIDPRPGQSGAIHLSAKILNSSQRIS
jgi:hypothetical protein